MCSTRAPVASATAAARVVLPEPAGPSMQTSRPAAEQRRLRRARAPARPPPWRRTHRAHQNGSSEVRARAAVGRHRRRRTRPRPAGARRWCARTARRTWRAGTTPVSPTRSVAAAGPVSGVCTSPAPSSPVRCSAGRRPRAAAAGRRRAGRRRRSRRRATVTTVGVGRRSDRHPEERRRAGLEGLVVVEQARHQQPGAGRDLGDHRVGGRGLDRAGAAGVPELQRRRRRPGPRRSRGGVPPAARPRRT